MPEISLSYQNLFRGDVGKWLEDYHASLPDVIRYVQNFEGLKSHIGINSLRSATPYLHAALLLSDLTSISISDPDKKTIKICPDLAGSKITIPNAVIVKQNIDINTDWKNVGYTQSSNKAAKLFVKEIKPALLSGEAIIRPDRIAMFKKSDGNFDVVNCEPDCSKYEWIVPEHKMKDNSLPVKVLSDRIDEISLSLPYLKNISTIDFLQVLKRNNDCISTIRAALREATRDIHTKSEAEFRDIRADVIDPKLEELKRSFKRIIRASSIRIAATGVGTITASLTAAAVGIDGMALNSILGLGGFGLLAKEFAGYSEKLAYLKDNPFYLFWRMKVG